jgi:hypothetical protein
VGDATCNGCHTEIYDAYMASGHPFILNRVADGAAPTYPASTVRNPPEGYAWEDILFVVGGYNWKARFVDQQGYLITDAPGAPGDTGFRGQYNLPFVALAKDAGFVPYHAGEAQKPYDCAACHTTGYNPFETNELPGLVGSWVQEGVRCEECHGPGSLHVANPARVDMPVRRDGRDCMGCHQQDGVPQEAISEGFINHHDAYGDLKPGKHAVLDCVDCHDPHSGVVQLRRAGEQTTRVQCGECHYQMVGQHKVEAHAALNLGCLECHMPRLIQVATGEPRLFMGDKRTHQVAINPNQMAQFTEDGTEALPQVGLNFACRRCHFPGAAIDRPDEVLIEAANNYHEPAPDQTP